MRIRLVSTFAVIMMLSAIYMYARSVQQVSYSETESEGSEENSWTADDLEYLNEIMESIDFSVQKYPVNTAIYDSELDRKYKTAFLKVLFGQAPIQDEEKGEYYFGEIIPELNAYSNGIEMGDFMNVRYYLTITGQLNYHYMDFDGDGLPELITHYIRTEEGQDFGGPYILKYNPEDKQVYHFASEDEGKWELLGPGKLYYDDTIGARYSYGYQEINVAGEVSREVQFEETYSSNDYMTMHTVFSDGSVTSVKNITLKPQNWSQVRRDFRKAVDDAPTCMSFDALFRDIDVDELIAKVPPIFPNKIEHFAYDTDDAGFQSNGKQKSITYQVPIDEIAERIEYGYVYENMTDHIAGQDYKQLSFLPSGEDIALSVYIAEGNKILFLPEEKANTEAMVNDEPCRLHYCEEADGYVFYLLVDWQMSEMGIPVNSLENGYYYRIRECIVRDKDAAYEEVNPYTGDSPIYFAYEFELEDLVKLGDTKVTFDPEQTIELPEYNQDIDFYTMSPEETAELISYAYSYGEWFGMNKLGCMTGELRGLQDETIIMYRWKEGGGANRVYFVPKSKVNTCIKFGDGEYYPVYVNSDGDMEFFYLERSGYAKESGQLKTSYFIQDHYFSDLDTRYAEDMVCLGEAELTLWKLPSLDVPTIEEDEYVTALKEHIEDMLRQNGRSGKYEMNIGEYEAPYNNRVCLSAAVTGEEDSYYFRYLIVKSGQGNYYFWPAGFGLNGSLTECEAERHYMNALCIERTRQLERCSIVIEVE